MGKWIFVMLFLLIVLIVAAAVVRGDRMDKFRIACQTMGGVSVTPYKSDPICFDPKVLIEVK